MGQTNSTGAAPQAQSSVHPKDASRGDRSNVQMVQNGLLIWLDANIGPNSSDCQNTITQLRRIINTIKTFTDGEECVQFLKGMVNEKVCMIVSGSLGQQIVPHVHSQSQVDSIFIFCQNKKYHKEWVKDWSKIKGIFTDIGSLCEALKQAVQQSEQNTISTLTLDDSDSSADKGGNRLDPSFMYTQILKEILLTIKFEQKDIDEFVLHCREAFAGNEKQLRFIDKLAHEYQQHTPIWWYTFDRFLNPMLNRALETMDVNLMVKMGFFISDLHRHIEQLHQKEFGGADSKQRFTVYRGQGMDKKDFEEMLAKRGGLLSFNNFLSAHKDRSISMAFAEGALADDQKVGVLSVINIDSTRSSTPFASVGDVEYFGKDADEILFSMHTVFRIKEITSIDGNPRLLQVQMNLTSDRDNDLHELIDYMRKETFPNEQGWFRLGALLMKMGEFVNAQQVYETLLSQETKDSAKVSIYDQLGPIKDQQGEYKEAIAYYEKSIALKEKQIPRDDLSLATSYNKVGGMYESMGDYSKALLSYEKALSIRQQSLPPTHPDLASSYNKIGSVYFNMGDYAKALSSHQKALTIKQQSLPPTHPSLASTYDNVGLVYQQMGNYSEAHSHFKRAVDIGQQCLPPNHLDRKKWEKHLADNKKF